jgi:chemotaxis response regulator CheB
MSAAPTRIVVADHSPLHRKMVCSKLEKEPKLQVVAEEEDGID